MLASTSAIILKSDWTHDSILLTWTLSIFSVFYFLWYLLPVCEAHWREILTEDGRIS